MTDIEKLIQSAENLKGESFTISTGCVVLAKQSNVTLEVDIWKQPEKNGTVYMVNRVDKWNERALNVILMSAKADKKDELKNLLEESISDFKVLYHNFKPTNEDKLIAEVSQLENDLLKENEPGALWHELLSILPIHERRKYLSMLDEKIKYENSL